MVSYPGFARPIQANHLFPDICVYESCSYNDPENTATKLTAIRDAEEAFRLYRSGHYLLPENFSFGIEKISIVMGTEVTNENVKRLRKDLEKSLGIEQPSFLSFLRRQNFFLPHKKL